MRYRQFVAVVDRFPRSSIILLKDFRNAFKGILFLEIYSLLALSAQQIILKFFNLSEQLRYVFTYVHM